MKLLDLYAKAKEVFPFTLHTETLIKFLPRRASIDEIEYKYESQVKITKAKRISKKDKDENENEITKKQKKIKKV